MKDTQVCLICFNEAECKSSDISQNLISVYSKYLHSAITGENLRNEGENQSDSMICEDCFNSALELKHLTDQLKNIDPKIVGVVKETMDTVLEFSLHILSRRTQAFELLNSTESKNVIEISVPKGFGLLFSAFSRKSSVVIDDVVKEEPDFVYESPDYGIHSAFTEDPFFAVCEETPIEADPPNSLRTKIDCRELTNGNAVLEPINRIKPEQPNECCTQILKVNLTRLNFDEEGNPVIPFEKKITARARSPNDNVLLKGEVTWAKTEHPKSNKIKLKRKLTNRSLSTLMKTENVEAIREKSSGFQCRFCWKRHVKWEDHKNHLKEAHERKRQFQCYACDKTFSQKHHMDTHVRIHTGEKPFACSSCPKRFSDPTAYYRHTKIHTGEKKYKCTFCKYGTSDSGAFGRHKLTHSNDYEFKCKLCEKTFKIKYNYSQHLLNHAGVRPFKCSVCKKSLRTKISLERHMNLHTGRKPFKCNFCNKRFNTKMYLVSHSNTYHTGERPYSCGECSMSFSNIWSLRSHKKTHDNKVLNCNLCKFTTNQEADFQKHGESHKTENNTDFPHKCEDCKQYFKHKWTLKNHLKRFHSTLNSKS